MQNYSRYDKLRWEKESHAVISLVQSYPGSSDPIPRLTWSLGRGMGPDSPEVSAGEWDLTHLKSRPGNGTWLAWSLARGMGPDSPEVSAGEWDLTHLKSRPGNGTWLTETICPEEWQLGILLWSDNVFLEWWPVFSLWWRTCDIGTPAMYGQFSWDI